MVQDLRTYCHLLSLPQETHMWTKSTRRPWVKRVIRSQFKPPRRMKSGLPCKRHHCKRSRPQPRRRHQTGKKPTSEARRSRMSDSSGRQPSTLRKLHRIRHMRSRALHNWASVSSKVESWKKLPWLFDEHCKYPRPLRKSRFRFFISWGEHWSPLSAFPKPWRRIVGFGVKRHSIETSPYESNR